LPDGQNEAIFYTKPSEVKRDGQGTNEAGARLSFLYLSGPERMHNSLKEKVLESVDIVDLVGEHVALTRKGREYVGLCPFHDDHRPSLSVSPGKQIFKCWSCGAGGDVIKFVQLSQRVDFREALDILARRIGIEPHHQDNHDRSAALREQLRHALTWARAHFQRNFRETGGGKHAAAYARERGMNEATIARFGLGYAADAWNDLLAHATRAGISRDVLQQAGLVTATDNNRTYDRFRNRLIFPICDATGRPVAFGGRTLGNDPAKYLNSPETPLFSKSRVLYGLDQARKSITAAREAVVVEGYTDAVLLSQAGIEHVVATLGTALTDAHVKLLSSLSDRIIMCFDSDDAGLRAADRAVETALRHRVEVAVAVLEEGQDPADYVVKQGPEAFRSLLLSAIAALEFRWNRTLEAYRQGGQQGQRDALEAFLRFVARVTYQGAMDPVLDQGRLISRLSDLLALPAAVVYEHIAKARAAAARESSSTALNVSDLSEYDLATRRLPQALVIAVEELFGLALSTPECFDELKEALAAGSRFCEPWGRLNRVIVSLVERRGSYAKADVIKSCDDAALCELVSRASTRAAPGPDNAEACRAVSERLMTELDLLQMEDLRGQLRPDAQEREAQERAFDSLRDVARRHHSVLGAAHRWSAPR
jgi:DNA primase